MLIVALILAVIGLAALVTAVVTSNETIAWVCIGASGLGVLLLIVDAIRDRARRRAELPAAVGLSSEETTEVMEPVATDSADDETVYSAESFVNEEFDEAEKFEDAEEFTEAKEAEEAEELAEDVAAEDHPEELVHDEPDHDLPADDEADFPEPTEEAAVHVVSESYLEQDAEAEDADVEVLAGSAGEDIVAESTAELSSSTDLEADTLSVVDTYPSAETENVDTEDSPVGEERRDQ